MNNSIRKIKLTQGKYAVVDADMYDFLTQWTWCAYRDRNTFYASTHVPMGNGKRKSVQMHQVISGQPLSGRVTDHINHDGLDNRRKNLRHVSRRENSSNRVGKDSGKYSSKFIGVSWNKRDKKWTAYIQISSKKKLLGYFKSETAASEAYRKSLKEVA